MPPSLSLSPSSGLCYRLPLFCRAAPLPAPPRRKTKAAQTATEEEEETLSESLRRRPRKGWFSLLTAVFLIASFFCRISEVQSKGSKVRDVRGVPVPLRPVQCPLLPNLTQCGDILDLQPLKTNLVKYALFVLWRWSILNCFGL